MIGFAETIAFLLALGGVGVDANPKAPTAAAVLEHYVEDADVVVHLDAAALVPRNYRAVTEVAKNPVIQNNPAMRDAAQKIISEIESSRGMVKGMLGIDPVTDVGSLTAFIKARPTGDPDIVVVVRGQIPADIVSKAAGMAGGKIETIDGRSAAALGDDGYIGMTKGGLLVLGTPTLVKPRIANAWKAAPRGRGDRWASLAQALDQKPFFAVSLRPSPALLKEMTDGGKNAMSDWVANIESAVWALHHDGMTWSTTAKTEDFAKRYHLFDEGFVELLRACHIAPRGIAKMVVASIESYRGTSPEIDVVIKYKDDILKLVNDFTGDGKFKATLSIKGRTTDARLTGKSLSEVLPVGLLLPFGAAGALAFSSRKAEEAKVEPPPRPVVTPRKGGGVTQPAPRPTTPRPH